MDNQSNLIKDQSKQLNKVLQNKDLDTVLEKIKKVDNTCNFTKCKKTVNDFCIHCKYCNHRFCTTHGLPEIHGCGEAVRRDEKKKFLHPGGAKLPESKHLQAEQKLHLKLKQLNQERKQKNCKSKK